MAEVQLTEEEEIELMDSMASGALIPEREIEDTGANDSESDDPDIEDTDQDADDDFDADTNEDDDGDTQDTDDDDSDDEEEYSLDDDTDDNEDREDDSDKDSDEDSDDDDLEDGDDSDGDSDQSNNDSDDDDSDEALPASGDANSENTDDTPAEDATADTDTIDYKKFYEDVAIGTVVVNGKTIPKLTDPAQIIQSIQMAGGYSDKMAGFKKYRPFMGPLKERGMLDNPEKFAMAMDIMDGNEDAIAAHLKTLNIEPIDLEADDGDTAYAVKTHVPTTGQLDVEDTFDEARRLGIGDTLEQVVLKDWDDESFREFVDNPAVRRDLVNHIATGTFDIVDNKIQQLKLIDASGRFGGQSAIQQYKEAVNVLNQEAERTSTLPSDAQNSSKPADTDADKAKVKSVKDRIANERRKAEYLAKASKQEKKVAAQRRKATSVSRRKPKAKVAKAFDPLEVEGAELDALMDSLITQGKGFN